MTTTFGDAVVAMKQGKMATRKGWNGSGMFVFMQVPALVPHDVIPRMTSLPQAVKERLSNRNADIQYCNQMALVKPDSTIHGWAPSVSDALADDWEILD